MANELLPDSVKGFIRKHIQSVAQIEILAMMHGAREREWTPRAIDESLRSNEEFVAKQLAAFTRRGILVESGGTQITYRYQPLDPELDAAIVETLQAYRTRPVLVIETIFKPDDPAQGFADAFRIRPR